MSAARLGRLPADPNRALHQAQFYQLLTHPCTNHANVEQRYRFDPHFAEFKRDCAYVKWLASLIGKNKAWWLTDNFDRGHLTSTDAVPNPKLKKNGQPRKGEEDKYKHRVWVTKVANLFLQGDQVDRNNTLEDCDSSLSGNTVVDPEAGGDAYAYLQECEDFPLLHKPLEERAKPHPNPMFAHYSGARRSVSTMWRWF